MQAISVNNVTPLFPVQNRAWSAPAAEASPDQYVPVTHPLDSRGQTLSTLGGADAARSDLQKLSQALAQMSPIPSQTYLINGNSGTGKRTLVEALAGDLAQSGIQTLAVSGGELVQKGPNALSQAFDEAQQAAQRNGSAVLFIDDIDAVSRIRSNDSTTTAIDASNMLYTLTNHIDQNSKVVVIGATSRKDSMDWSATQRFQHTITTTIPANPAERFQVLKAIGNRTGNIVNDAVLQDLAEGTGGKSQQDLKFILDRARDMANGNPVQLKDAQAARLEFKSGPAIPLDSPDWMFRLSVCHELGHAVIRHLFDDMALEEHRPDQRPLPIDLLSFVPREGVTASVELKLGDNPTKTLPYYYAEMASNYGGRAAEYLFGDGHVSAGPGNDLYFASQLAQEAVTQKGMGQTLGSANPSQLTGEEFANRSQADKQKLTSSTEQAAMSVVSFYGDFIRSSADRFLPLAKAGATNDLIWSGADFTQAVHEWENASPERAQQLTGLKNYLRGQMNDLAPRMPDVFDPATGGFVPARQVADNLKFNF